MELAGVYFRCETDHHALFLSWSQLFDLQAVLVVSCETPKINAGPVIKLKIEMFEA